MLRIVVMLIALVSMSACGFRSAASEDVEASRSAVVALVQRWSDASETGDLDALADTYADREGFAWIERGEVRYADHASILAGIESVRDTRASIKNDVSEIVVTPLTGGVAVFHAQYAFEVAGEAFHFTSRGAMSGVAIKQGEEWRFLQGAFSELPADITQIEAE